MSLRVMKKYGSVILGTDKFQGVSCKNMIKAALTAGYRIVDTAQAYGNEEVIGQAIQETTTVHRDDLFLITKISSGWKKNPQSVAEAYESAQKSLDRLGVPYMDLFLIHSPGEDAGARQATWQGLEQLRIDGLTKYIGVSNYDVTHLAEMATYSTIGPPAVNQIEKELVALCHRQKIAVQAYCSIVRNQRADDPGLCIIADRYSKTTQQILIRYGLQREWTPVVRSGNSAHLAENADVGDFQLTEEDMAEMNSWDQGGNGAVIK